MNLQISKHTRFNTASEWQRVCVISTDLPTDTLTKAFKLMFTDSRIAAGKLQYKSNNKTVYIVIVDFLSNCRSSFLFILWIFYFMRSQCSNKNINTDTSSLKVAGQAQFHWQTEIY